MKQLILLAISLLAGLGSLPAQAATATGTFTVTINFSATCSVDTTGLAPVFTYTSGQAAAGFDTPQSFNVTCSNSTPYTLSLDAGGTGYTGSYTAGTGVGSYTDTVSTMAYTLTLASTSGTGNGNPQNVGLTGLIAANQFAAGGTGVYPYVITNTHTITVTY